VNEIQRRYLINAMMMLEMTDRTVPANLAYDEVDLIWSAHSFVQAALFYRLSAEGCGPSSEATELLARIEADTAIEDAMRTSETGDGIDEEE